MKRLSNVLLILILTILGLLWGNTASAAVSGDFEYEQNGDGNTVSITGYNGTATDIIIPDKINNKTVTGIGDYAFIDKKLTSVKFNSSLVNIGEFSFMDNSIKSVTIPSSVEIIGDGAFSRNELTNVVINQGVKYIEVDAFKGNQLKSVTIPSSVEVIGNQAFANNKLTNVTISSGVLSIEYGAFKNNALTSVTIPATVNNFGDQIFDENMLKKVKYEGNEIIYGYTIGRQVKVSNQYPFFIDWYMDSNFNTVVDNAGFKKNTIYSGWILKLAYNANGATSGKVPVQNNPDFEIFEEYKGPHYISGKSIKLSNEGTLKKTGHSFVGWNTKKDGKGKGYKAGASFTFGQDNVTLYAQWKPNALAAKNVTITNNISSDKIALKGLTKDFTYTIYTDAKLTKKFTSFKATGTTKTISKKLNDKGGTLYIVVTKSGSYLKSDVTKKTYKAQPTKALSVKNVKVTNGKKKDTIKLTGLKKGTKYVIYKDSKKSKKLKTFTATGTSKTITVSQLGKKAGKIYITAQTPGYQVSTVTTVKYSKEK